MTIEIIPKIVKSLRNSLDYYNQTKDINDLVYDLNELIDELTIGSLE